MSAARSDITVRRQWAPWRTPWIWRKLRSRSRAHRGSATSHPSVFSYDGEPSGVGSFLTGALNQLVGGSPLNAMDSANPGAFLAGQAADSVMSQAAEALLSLPGPGSGSSGGSSSLLSGSGGGGGGGSFFDDLDEAAVVIIAVIAVAIFLIVAIPLGILAVELVIAMLIVLVGLVLRVAHVRPWTILVRQGGVTTAAFSVTGWRSSHRVLVGLCRQRETLLAAPRQPGRFQAPSTYVTDILPAPPPG